MLVWKKDVLSALKDAGYNSARLRKENILSQSTIQKLREGKGLGWENIDTICSILNCQPGTLIRFIPNSTAPADPPQD